MNEFAVAVIKGLYPFYLCLFLIGIGCRIRNHRWTAFDSLLLASFLLFILFSAFQIPLFYGIFVTSKRYLWVGLPLYLPLAAEGVTWLLKHPDLKIKNTILCIALIGVNIYNVYSPIIHERHSVKKRMEQKVSCDVAEWIKEDWRNNVASPVPVFKYDQYQSGKRPLIQSNFTRIGYLCGGQNYPDFFCLQEVLPDYIVSRSSVTPPQYILVKRIDAVNVYKRVIDRL